MGLFDSAFSNLPKIATDARSSIGSAVSFTVASAQTKVAEAASSVGSTLGSAAGKFTTLGANMPSFETLKAAAMKAGSVLLGGTGELVQNQINDTMRAQGGSLTAASLNASVGAATTSTDHLFTLTAVSGDGQVTFKVMPEVVEARTVQYEAVAPAQFPGAFQKYKGTDSVQWTLNATFVARTTMEATENLNALNTLRGWTMPYFGDNTGANFPGMLGAPPDVLMLKGLRKLIAGPVPVVITSLNWNWPKDVDYLPTFEYGDDGNPVPFPAVMNVAIQVVESWSTTQFNQFDLEAYRRGDMAAAFNKPLSLGESKTSTNTAVVPALATETVASSSVTGGGQSSAEFAANDPRRLDRQSDAGAGRGTSAFAAVDPRRLDR